MRKTIFSLALLFSVIWVNAQSGFNYKILLSQGTNIMANQAVTLRLTLKDGGTTVYQETQSSTTDANGIASVIIGTGTVVSGSFPGIDWMHDISLQTEVSTDGGSSYTDFGTTPFEYVPYAKMSESARKLEQTTTPVSVTYAGSGNYTTTIKYNEIHFSDQLSGTTGNDWYIGMAPTAHYLFVINDAHQVIKIDDSDNKTYFYDDVQVNGDVRFGNDAYVGGKLKGSDSGNADMKAYIYGVIRVDAGITTSGSSGGFTSSHVSTGHYRITFTNSPGSRFYYTVVVTPWSMTHAVSCSVMPYNSYFDIFIWDSDGNATDEPYYFVVYKK